MDGGFELPTTAGAAPADLRARLLKSLHNLVRDAQKAGASQALVNAASAAWRAVDKDGPAGGWRRLLAALAPFLADPEFDAYEPAILQAVRLALSFAPVPESPEHTTPADAAVPSDGLLS